MIDQFKYLITVFVLLTVSELFFASAQIELEPIGNYQNRVFDKSKDGVYNHWPCPGQGSKVPFSISDKAVVLACRQ